MKTKPAAGKFSLRSALRQGVQLWEKPAAAMLFAWVVYALLASAHGPLTAVSVAPYYLYQADAFLHGQLAVRQWPCRCQPQPGHRGTGLPQPGTACSLGAGCRGRRGG